MPSRLAAAALLCCAAIAAAQSPSSAFPRGNSLQAWQDPRLPALLATCENPAEPHQRRTPPARSASEPGVSTEIAGVIAGGQTWNEVWSWEGNNVDGLIAGDGGTLIFANNDASNVMRLDPATGLATVIHDDTNTGGAVSRSKTGALFVLSRGVRTAVMQLEPVRKVLASSFHGDPLDCVGGVPNDLSADARGGVYFTISDVGLFYADPQGTVSQYGGAMRLVNGIILSPDEKTLYVTNGAPVVAFDVEPDGSLTNQREFATIRSGRMGDGSTVDAEGRLYVATGSGADVFAPSGEFLGTIPGVRGMHGVAFGGPDKRTLYGIVFSGEWGTESARNQILAIPMIAQGYRGRAK